LRVLQIMAGASQGGAETYFADLVLALGRAGLEQHAAIRTNADRAALLRDGNILTTELKFGGLDFSTRRGLRTIIGDFKPDVVQTWMNRATRHCPTGSFVHVGWLGGYYAPKYFTGCDHVVGVTQNIVDHMRASGGWVGTNSHYLPTFAPNVPAPPVPRITFDTPEDVTLFLALGRLHTKKAFDILLESLALIPGAYLWIAGEGPLETDLKQQTARLGLGDRVRFLGWRTDREALLGAADVCVMPSRFEPFGTVMVEAWGAKTPLIVADADGPKRTVKPDVDAIMVPMNDVQALADAMRRLIAEPKFSQALVKGGFEHYQEKFNEDAVMKQYLKFYSEITA
jgi:glycosyltransferase involved in cell wall biosynthesis